MRKALLAATCAIVLTACGSASAPTAGDTFAASATGQFKPEAITLTDTAGAPFDLARTPHTPLTLVFFGYTHCPDECPAVMSQLSSAFTRLTAAQKAKVTMVFVTTDPTQDTPVALRKWLDRYDTSFIGVTAPIGKTEALARSLKMFVEGPTRLPSGGWDAPMHDTHVVALNDQHLTVAMWRMETTSKQYARDITALLDGKTPQ